LALPVTVRKRSIVALQVEGIRTLQILLGSSVFFLDKSLSWMPHVARLNGHPVSKDSRNARVTGAVARADAM
jgi:hypothetical protein